MLAERIINEWVFINYCTQKVGMWDKNDMVDGVCHVFKIEIANLFAPLVFIPYFSFTSNMKGFYVLLILYIAFIWYSPFVNKKLKSKIKGKELRKKYISISKTKRVLNFFLGILIGALCILTLIFSFSLLNYTR